MAEVQFSSDALHDLADIAHYTAERWGEAQSENYLRLLDACFKQLGEQPLIGRARPELAPELRSWVCQHHTIFYQPAKPAVVIIRVLDSRRDVRGLNHEA